MFATLISNPKITFSNVCSSYFVQLKTKELQLKES